MVFAQKRYVRLTVTQCLRYILLLLLSSFSVSILIFYVEQKKKKFDCHVDSVTAEGGWKVSIKEGFYRERIKQLSLLHYRINATSLTFSFFHCSVFYLRGELERVLTDIGRK